MLMWAEPKSVEPKSGLSPKVSCDSEVNGLSPKINSLRMPGCANPPPPVPPGRDPTPRGNQGGRGGGGRDPPVPENPGQAGPRSPGEWGGDLHDTAEADLLQVSSGLSPRFRPP